jgi:hypothetical protein
MTGGPWSSRYSLVCHSVKGRKMLPGSVGAAPQEDFSRMDGRPPGNYGQVSINSPVNCLQRGVRNPECVYDD